MVLTIAAVAYSASDGRAHQRDSPVSPEAMQKMIGKGFDVRWAEFDGDMQECVHPPEGVLCRYAHALIKLQFFFIWLFFLFDLVGGMLRVRSFTIDLL